MPPGYHIQSSISDNEPSPIGEAPDVPFVYPAGIGSVMMNGCYGRNYSSTDPCFNSRAKSTICWVSVIKYMKISEIYFAFRFNLVYSGSYNNPPNSRALIGLDSFLITNKSTDA